MASAPEPIARDYQPLSRICTLEDLLRVASAANWVLGFMAGNGHTVPAEIAEDLQILSQWTRR